MEMFVSALGVTMLAIACAVGLAAIVFGLPGTVLIAGSGLAYAWAGGFERVSLATVLAVAFLALVAEGLEFLLGARLGGPERPSVKVSLAVVVGGFVGGLLGAPFFFGLGSLPGALAGAFAGAALMRAAEGGGLSGSLATGRAAAKGRLLGFIAKTSVAVVMTVLLLGAAVS